MGCGGVDDNVFKTPVRVYDTLSNSFVGTGCDLLGKKPEKRK